MVNALFTLRATAPRAQSPAGTSAGLMITRPFPACSPPPPLLRARSYPPGTAAQQHRQPDDLAVVAELVDAQR